MSAANVLFWLRPQMSGPQVSDRKCLISSRPQMSGPQKSGPQMSAPQMWVYPPRFGAHVSAPKFETL
uniref:Uncharacterized protein n=1 Tax=Globodera rostochiensis TaxID=31243 RepID=A0A914GXQ4_GLORO